MAAAEKSWAETSANSSMALAISFGSLRLFRTVFNSFLPWNPARSGNRNADGPLDRSFDLPHERLADGSSEGAADQKRFVQRRDLFALGHGSFPQASFASRKFYMRRGRAQRRRQRHHNHIVRQWVPDVHGNDQGRPGLGSGRVPGERDQVDVTTAWIGHGAYSSQIRLAPSAAMVDHSLSSSCSAGERER